MGEAWASYSARVGRPASLSARNALGTNLNPDPLRQQAALAEASARSKAFAVNDAYWQERSALPRLPGATAPVMYTTDLYDIVQPFGVGVTGDDAAECAAAVDAGAETGDLTNPVTAVRGGGQPDTLARRGGFEVEQVAAGFLNNPLSGIGPHTEIPQVHSLHDCPGVRKRRG